MNKAILVGNLTRDPELSTTSGGKSVCRFTLAVQRRFKRDEADFISITVWGAAAENCSKYLHKGSKCAISGEIRTGSYDKDGVRVYTTDVNADEVQFLNSKNDASNDDYEQLPTPKKKSSSNFDSMKSVDDEELPF